MMPEAIMKRTWTKVAFGDVVQLSKKRSKTPEADGLERYVGLEHLEPGDLKIRRWGDITDGKTFTNVFRAGQVLFGKRRDYQRKVAVAGFSGVCSGDIYVLETKGKDLLPELLPFLCQTDAFFNHAVGTSAGSLSPRTNWKSLATFEFALPPLEEQRRIAEVLLAAECCRNKFAELEGTLKQVQKVILTRSFTTDLTDISDWPSLDSLCSRIGDGTHLPPPFTKTGIPFLLVSHITGGEVDWNTEKFVSEESYRELTKTWRPQMGDLLYSLVGSFGIPAKVETEERFTFQRHIGLIRANPDELLVDYLYWYLRSPAGYRQAMWRAEGLAQKTITLGALRAFRIPWRPIHEQQLYVEQFEEIEVQRAELLKRESEVGRLTAGLINSQLVGRNQ